MPNSNDNRPQKPFPVALVAALLVGGGIAIFAFLSTQNGEADAAPSNASAKESVAETRIPVTLRGKTMGTTYAVKVLLTPEQSTTVGALQAKIDAALEQVNDDMSTWRKDSDLSKFNAHASTTPYVARDSTVAVMNRALTLGEKTGGAFDVTLGPLIRLWGFGRDGRRDAPPDAKALEEARARVGLDKLSIEGTSITKARPDVDVSLAGIAKGYGVDEVGRVVVAEGISNALVEIGGEVRAYGHGEGGRPWRVGVNVPRADAAATDIALAVPLKDQALATSGDYRNFFEQDGKRYGHIIDPRTARPVDHQVLSASVVAPDCTTADGLATAMLVLGREAGTKVIEQMDGVEALFLEDDGSGGYRVTHTAGFPLPPSSGR